MNVAKVSDNRITPPPSLVVKDRNGCANTPLQGNLHKLFEIKTDYKDRGSSDTDLSLHLAVRFLNRL